MGEWLQILARFMSDEEGPTAVEYAIMLSLIILVCFAAIGLLGSNASAKFDTIATSLGGSS